LRSPVLLGAALLLVASLVPEASRGRSLETVLGRRTRQPARVHRATALMGQAQLLLGSGVAALAFFGGAHLPGADSSLVPSFGSSLGRVALVLVKAWSIAGGIATLRWILGRVDIDEVRGLTLRVALPASAVLLGLASLARQAPFERLLAVSDRGVAWASLAGWLVLTALVARRAAPGRALAEGDRGPNPWL
jgi:hypothetical protein